LAGGGGPPAWWESAPQRPEGSGGRRGRKEPSLATKPETENRLGERTRGETRSSGGKR